VSESGRFVVFLVTALAIWAGLHVYVLWSVGRAPLAAAHLPRRLLVGGAVALGASYLVGRLLDGAGLHRLAYPLELVGALWIGLLFLTFLAVLLCDLARLALLIAAPTSGRVGDAATWLAANLPAVGAAVALLLAAVGIYGVMNWTVVERRREIGVRMAAGATPLAVAGLVLRDGGRTLAAGLAIGIATAAVLGRLLSGMLFGVTPADPVTYGSTVAVLALVGAASLWFPAYRASRVDPITVLRE
jgi:hypothetical protein